MNVDTPKLRKLAQFLIVREATAGASSTSRAVRAFSIIEKLRPHLTNLMGNAGFAALLARALVLASTEFAWLGVVRLSADGAWEGLEELDATVSANDFLDARVRVLAHLLGLLVAFVGERLMLRLVTEVWPDLSLNDLDFGKKGKNEKAK